MGQGDAPEISNVSFTVDSSIIDAEGNISEQSSGASLGIVDVYDMMKYSLKNYNTEIQDFEFLLDLSEEASSQYDTKSIRRLEKTIPALHDSSNH